MSVEESPVTVIPVPAVKVRVSVELSATGEVPEVVVIVSKELTVPPVLSAAQDQVEVPVEYFKISLSPQFCNPRVAPSVPVRVRPLLVVAPET